MNLDDYSYEFEDRRYLNPQVSLDEQNAFINNLRGLQADRNAEIAKQTYALGTQTPSSLGGLAGGGGYFRSRYQTPQINSMISDLRAAAQAQALTTLLQNEIDKEKKRYKKAANAANAKANSNGNNTQWKTTTKDDGSSGLYKEDYVGTEEIPLIGTQDNSSDFNWGTAAIGGLGGLAIGSLIPIPGLGLVTGAAGAYFGGKPHYKTITKSFNTGDSN